MLGVNRPSHNAEIIPGQSITLYGEQDGKAYSKTFKIGDIAEYDSYNLSYNLSYLGKIVSITAKTVTIQPSFQARRPEPTRRLKVSTFEWRNYD
jgi:hypothetical protein